MTTNNNLNNNSSTITVSDLNIANSTISTITTNTDIIFSPNGSGVLSVDASSIIPSTDRVDNLGTTANSWGNLYANGLSFDDGANTMSAFTAQTSYTPVLSFGGDTTGITYDTQVGSYFILGPIVFYTFTLRPTSLGTATGIARISLPTTISAAGTNPVGNLYVESSTLLTFNYCVLDLGSITSGAANMVAIVDNSTPTNITNTNLLITSYIVGNGFYWE
jgi:hypothetical protein